ncbi:hypothetical protein Poli38472_000355 [Pythium oligandrum]|uniref:HORMA domain-containing protein n=1 Tax=Pythium oligandrum TaxID=41045 RepID=A0A8K1FJ21_PYTOL|nr:hypothetical protein Poli38472_000355 [Pythium oligandrum]|eukprot:TMW60313.1 hypothetical protein Poli38472_000355 [Pythium oligandrum]
MQIESRGPAIRSVMRFLRWLFGPQGFFGIKGPHFRALFLSQQLVLVVFRAYQASQLSASVPHVLTVWSYSALVVAHCWSFLVIRRLCNHSPGLVRLCFVLSDACLGIITTIIFPAILATKYVKAYDSKLTNFPIHLNQDAVFSATMVVELHRILVASWTDLFVRIVMSISILISLGDAKVLIEKVDARSASDTSPHLEDIAESAVVPESKRPITLVLKLVIFAVGATILAFQLKAQQKSHNHSCVLPVHPWGTGRPGCALIRLNCTLEGIQGSKDEVTTILTAYSPDSVQVLELLSCPALRIPSYIQSFGHLMRIYMKKSHLVEWDVDAALTRAYHPRLSTLQIQDSQLPNGLIPPGLMDPDFPPNLRIISLLALNLVDLPLAVAAAWPPGTVLRLESMNLTQIPPVLFRMALYYLSLENTALTEIPVELFYTPVLMYLNLKAAQIEVDTEKGAKTPTMELVRVVTSQFCRLRRLFPPECFTLRSVEADEEEMFHVLKKPPLVDNEAERLYDLLEYGVAECIDRCCLRRMVLRVHDGKSHEVGEELELAIEVDGNKPSQSKNSVEIREISRKQRLLLQTLAPLPPRASFTVRLELIPERLPYPSWIPAFFTKAPSESTTQTQRPGNHQRQLIALSVSRFRTDDCHGNMVLRSAYDALEELHTQSSAASLVQFDPVFTVADRNERRHASPLHEKRRNAKLTQHKKQKVARIGSPRAPVVASLLQGHAPMSVAMTPIISVARPSVSNVLKEEAHDKQKLSSVSTVVASTPIHQGPTVFKTECG